MTDKDKEPMGERDDRESGQPVQLDKDKHEQKDRPQHQGGQSHQDGQKDQQHGAGQQGGMKK